MKLLWWRMDSVASAQTQNGRLKVDAEKFVHFEIHSHIESNKFVLCFPFQFVGLFLVFFFFIAPICSVIKGIFPFSVCSRLLFFFFSTFFHFQSSFSGIFAHFCFESRLFCCSFIELSFELI